MPNPRLAMKNLTTALIAVLFATTLAAQNSRPQTKPTAESQLSAKDQLAAMTWMAGNWQGKDSGGATWIVNYTKPEGGLLLGTSKCLRDGSLRSFEFEQFRIRGDKLLVTPFPNGRKSVSFTLTKFDRKKRLARFENPKHDFPQRLEYWRKGDKTLVIRVLGRDERRGEGKWRGFQVTLKKGKKKKKKKGKGKEKGKRKGKKKKD